MSVALIIRSVCKFTQWISVKLLQIIALICLLGWIIWLGYLFINGIDDDGTTESLLLFMLMLVGPPLTATLSLVVAGMIQDP